MAAYGLMERLLEEQCQVIKKKQRPSRDDDDAGEGGGTGGAEGCQGGE